MTGAAVSRDRAWVRRSFPLRTSRITASDFFTGMLASLSMAQVSSVSMREDFYEAVTKAYEVLCERSSQAQIEVGFRFMLDPVYRDSAGIRQGVSAAVQSNLVSLDNPEYRDMRLTIGAEEARLLIESLPGSAAIYRDTAEAFLREYPYVLYSWQQEP